jgi:hypothetical protein
MTDERIKEGRNKAAKIIVARLLGSLEATPLNISMIETLLVEVEYEIKIARDLLEARELIKEMSQTLLTISQYPIASVCEDVRTLARNEWEKSKEYAE